MDFNGKISVETFGDRFTWVIDNFCCFWAHRHIYKSPQFTSRVYHLQKYDDIVWNLTYEPNPWSKIQFFLNLKDCSQEKVEGSLKAFILINENVKSDNFTALISLKKGESLCIALNIDHFKKISTNDCHLPPNKKLTIVCEITVNNRYTKKRNSGSLSEDLKIFMPDEMLSDATLYVDGKLFQVHKFILIARSPVFRAMLENKLSEEVIEITDVSDDVMQEVLRFIYRGKVENIEKLASGILIAADKFQLEDLKVICLEFLRNNLRVSNALDTLIVADVCREDQLKKIIFDYIISHLKNLDMNILSPYPHLFKEILIHCQVKDKCLIP